MICHYFLRVLSVPNPSQSFPELPEQKVLFLMSDGEVEESDEAEDMDEEE